MHLYSDCLRIAGTQLGKINNKCLALFFFFFQCGNVTYCIFKYELFLLMFFLSLVLSQSVLQSIVMISKTTSSVVGQMCVGLAVLPNCLLQ